MKVITAALGALLGATALSSPVSAQISPQVMAQGRVARSVEFGARVTTAYDSNLSRTSKSRAEETGIDPSDTVVTPSLSANIIAPVGRQAVFLNGTISYIFHDKNDDLDSSRIDLNGGVGGSFGPCGTVLTGDYSRGRTDFDDLTLDTTIRNIRETETVGVNVACTRATGLGIVLSGSHSWVSSSLIQFAISDSETTSGSAGISYGRPSLGSVSIFGSYSRTDYPDRPTVTPGTSGFETRAAGVSYERRLGGRIRGSLSVSYTEAEDIGPPLPGAVLGAAGTFSGVTYDANASYRASSRLQFQADFERSVNPTVITSGSFEVQTSYSVNANYRLGTRITLGAGARRSDIDLDGAGFGPPALALTDSRSTQVFGSVSYRQSDRASLIFDYTNEQRDSDNSAFNYTNNRVSLSLNVTF